MRALLCCLALAAFPAAGTPAPLTPEAAFERYARTLLQDDRDAPRALDARARPAPGAFDGRPPDGLRLAEALSMVLPDILFHGTDVDAVDAAKQHWATAVLRRAQCRSTHSDVWHRVSDDHLVADIRFTCTVGDVDALRTLYDAALFDGQDRDNTRFWSAYRTRLRDGPFREASGTTRLVAAPGSSAWRSEEPGKRTAYGQVEADVGKVLMDAWLPMRGWTFETLSRVERRMTLVADCDGLIHQYRRCAARFAPRELLGADALAERLSEQHKEVAEAELATQCAALRPKIEALWPAPCE